MIYTENGEIVRSMPRIVRGALVSSQPFACFPSVREALDLKLFCNACCFENNQALELWLARHLLEAVKLVGNKRKRSKNLSRTYYQRQTELIGK
jgi:hypothetical protein